MGTDSDRIPREAPVVGTNKIVSRIEVMDLCCPTAPMEMPTDASLVIEEHVPTLTGEHPVLVGRDSLLVPVIDLRASGLVPIDDRASAEAAPKSDTSEPLALSDHEVATMNAIAATTKHRNHDTSLGVAPLEPATTVRAPFVVDTPVPRTSPLGQMTPSSAPVLESSLVTKPGSSANLPPVDEPARDHTAMLVREPSSGVPRRPWQALVAVARSLRRLLRRTTSPPTT